MKISLNFLILIALTSACTKTKEVIKETPIEKLEVVPQNIDSAPKEVQEKASAMGLIVDVAGNSGSGFFISSDGLFLTNHHVLDEKRCYRLGCPGVIIVRDYHAKGKKVVYNEYEVLGHSSALDMTLLAVKLKEGERVPFLKLSTKLKKDESKDSYVLGHTAGGYLKWTKTGQASVNLSDPYSITNVGVVFKGNSGGALINAKTGAALGLVKQVTSIQLQKNKSSAYSQTSLISTRIDLLLKELITSLDIKSASDLSAASASFSGILDSEFFSSPKEEYELETYIYQKIVLRDDGAEDLINSALSAAIGFVLEGPNKFNEAFHEFYNGDTNLTIMLLVKKYVDALGGDFVFSEKNTTLAVEQTLSEFEIDSKDEDYKYVKKVLQNTFKPRKNQTLAMAKECSELFSVVEDGVNNPTDLINLIVANLTYCNKLPTSSKLIFDRILKYIDWTPLQFSYRAELFGALSLFLRFMDTSDKAELKMVAEFLTALEAKETTVETRMRISALREQINSGLWSNLKFKIKK